MNTGDPQTDIETRKQALCWDGVSSGFAYRTEGARLSCLVNASVTVCAEDTIYAFGGFDQFTDEVFNHVLKLDLKTFTWKLVDNYGDIPSVRMGHTATYWKDDKLIIFGGEDERRVFLSDVYIFDIPTATWSQPVISGHPPPGRSRHAVALHDDKLFIHGGIHAEGPPSPEDELEPTYRDILDDVCYLDLKTMTWSRSWKWIPRFDHSAWIRDGKLIVYGGMGREMDRRSELVTLDIKHPAFSRPRTDSGSSGYTTRQLPADNKFSPGNRVLRSHRTNPNSPRSVALSNHTPPPAPRRVPSASNSISFLSGPSIPSVAHGAHFHHVVGSNLITFVTSTNNIRSPDTAILSLSLRTHSWRRLAPGPATLGGTAWRWHYIAAAPNSTTVYLLGCPSAPSTTSEDAEYLSHVLPLDLRTFGIRPPEPTSAPCPPASLGADLSQLLAATTTDFTLRCLRDDADPTTTPDPPPEHALAPAINVHQLILLARWPHFRAVHAARMKEFHTAEMFLPEPHHVVAAFVAYLYTDNIAAPALHTVAGLLPLARLYDLPRLRAMCLERLFAEVGVETCAVVWEKAVVAGEEGLRRRAREVVWAEWGRVVRTEGFRGLGERVVELCREVGEEGRIVAEAGEEAAGREAEVVGREGEAAEEVELEDADGDEEMGGWEE